MISKNLLVLDDDFTYAKSLEINLRTNFNEIFIAHSISQGLCFLKKHQQINYVLLDLNLPDGNGLQFLKEALLIDKKLKIIVLTAYSSVATAVEAIKLGAIDYLIKPVLTDDILKAMGFKNPRKFSHIPIIPPSSKRVEWEHIQRILKENDYNISATAKALNMHRRTLQRKLQKKPVSS